MKRKLLNFYHLHLRITCQKAKYKILNLWQRFLSARVKMSKETFSVLLLFVLLIGCGLGMWWRSAQVDGRYQAEITRLEAQNAKLVEALFYVESLKAIVKNAQKKVVKR